VQVQGGDAFSAREGNGGGNGTVLGLEWDGSAAAAAAAASGSGGSSISSKKQQQASKQQAAAALAHHPMIIALLQVIIDPLIITHTPLQFFSHSTRVRNGHMTHFSQWTT